MVVSVMCRVVEGKKTAEEDRVSVGGYKSFFFVKQKTAYEMLRSLVGSEMCIRNRL